MQYGNSLSRSKRAKPGRPSSVSIASDLAEADRRLKRQISASLDRKGEHALARRIATCRSIRLGGFPCGKVWACEFCAWVSAKGDRYERTARALLALERDPELSFTFVTLTAPVHTNLRASLRVLTDTLSTLHRATTGAWSKLAGMLWWIEPHRSRSGGYRPHLHAIAALNVSDAPRYPRALVLKWARRVCRDRAKSLGLAGPDEREFLEVVRHCQIKPLRSYANSCDPLPPNPAFRVTTDCNPSLLPFDLMDTAEYSRRDERLKHRTRHDGHRLLSADDRVELTLLGRTQQMRNMTGVFRGMNDFDLDDLVAQLRELDSPSQRKRTVEQALSSPDEAYSLLPRTGRSSGTSRRKTRTNDA